VKIRFRNPFASDQDDEPKGQKDGADSNENENVIAHDNSKQVQVALKTEQKESEPSKKKSRFSLRSEKKKVDEDLPILAKSRNPISKFAYNLLGGKLPGIPQYKETYEQAGMPLIYEAYLSTGFLLGFIIIIPTFIISFLLELHLFPHGLIAVSLLGSGILGAVVFAGTLLLWLSYPIFRRRTFKSALENQLA
jgi:hypothetical protein